MTFKTSVASLAIIATLIGPVFAYAQEITPIAEAPLLVVEPTLTEQMQQELADLKTKELDSTTGFMTRFFIRIKIKELENKLNIASVLK